MKDANESIMLKFMKAWNDPRGRLPILQSERELVQQGLRPDFFIDELLKQEQLVTESEKKQFRE